MPCMQSKSIPDRMLQERKSQCMPEALQRCIYREKTEEPEEDNNKKEEK